MLIATSPIPMNSFASIRGHLLVAIGPDEHAEELVLLGGAVAAGLQLKWTVVSIENPQRFSGSYDREANRAEAFRLAQSMNADTAILDGVTPAQTLAAYALQRNASHIIVSSSKVSGDARFEFGAVTVSLLHRITGAEVIVVVPSVHRGPATPFQSMARNLWAHRLVFKSWRYGAALGLSALCSLVSLPLTNHVDMAGIAMLYLLATTIAALRLGTGPSILTAFVNVAAFDYFSVPPAFSFLVLDAQSLITLVVMLLVALVISKLMSAVHHQTEAAASRAHRTATLYAMSRDLTISRDRASMALVAQRHLREVFNSESIVCFYDAYGAVSEVSTASSGSSPFTVNLEVAQWVAQQRKYAGLGSKHEPKVDALYLPLYVGQNTVGVLAVKPAQPARIAALEQRRLLDALADQLALALDRARLAEIAEAARLAAEQDSWRNTMLASISHDLRTPLSAIAGAGSIMAHETYSLNLDRRITLGRLIEDKARDMSELISNVLELVRLEGGGAALRREWHSAEEILSEALKRNEGKLVGRNVTVSWPTKLPLVYVDFALFVQLFSNLFDNITKYTPLGTVVQISARREMKALAIYVDDSGPGLPLVERDRLFQKFVRGEHESGITGVGLGLSICRVVARLHGGDINAFPSALGGARFEITLPAEEDTPERACLAATLCAS